jgi:hypothetical protein
MEYFAQQLIASPARRPIRTPFAIFSPFAAGTGKVPLALLLAASVMPRTPVAQQWSV